LLDLRSRHLVGGELRLEREVTEPAGEDPTVRRLLPVVEAVASVVRALEQDLVDRLGGHHLPTRRDDEAFERPEQPAGTPVCRAEDVVRLEVVERFDAATLDDRDAARGRLQREPVDELGRLHSSVVGMEDRSREASADETRAPFGPETVADESLEL